MQEPIRSPQIQAPADVGLSHADVDVPAVVTLLVVRIRNGDRSFTVVPFPCPYGANFEGTKRILVDSHIAVTCRYGLPWSCVDPG